MTNMSLSKGLKWSTFAHFAFIFFVMIKSWVFPGQPLRYIPTLKVDLVALPDVLKKDLKAPSQQANEIQNILKHAEENAKRIQTAEKIPAEKAPPRPDHEMALAPKNATGSHTESKNRRALDRIRALEKIQDKVATQDSSDRRAEIVKGNKLSKGASLSGSATESLEANYLDVLRERIADRWFLPTWLARQNLDSLVRIHIDARGRMRSYRIVKSSGNEQFDQAVKQALDESQPFPVPPADLQDSLLAHGISVGFPL